MSYTPNNPNGQASAANSAPVVLDTTDSTNLASIATNTTGVSTAANQSAANTSLSSIATNTTGLATASAQTTANGSLSTIATNTTSIATASNQATANTSLSSIATNTTGLATASAQTTGNGSLATIATNSGSQATAANQTTGNSSLATIATNTTGAATAANQSTGNTSLSSIATSTSNIPAKGLAAVTASTPVALPNATAVTTTAYSSTTGVINTDILSGSVSGWYDVSAYNSMYLDIYTTTTITAGTLVFEQTNDTTNDASGTSLNLQDSTVLTQTNVTSLALVASTVKHYQAPITARYIRIRFSVALTGTGTVGATVNLKQTPYVPVVTPVAQATAGSLNMTVGSGTVTTVSTVTTLANGQTAHSSPSTGSPLRVAGRVNTTLDTTLTQGDASDLFISTAGQLIEKPYSTAENDWTATSALTPLATTTSTALKAAGAASIRNYCTAIQIFNTSSTVSTNVAILDGATVLWAGWLPAMTSSLPLVPIDITFPTPLKGTAATAMNIQLGTTAAAVYYNAQGYQSF